MGDTAIPSDSNGVYSLPSGYEAVTGEVIQASQHNPPLEDLESAMSLRLMRTGAAPMTGPLKIADGSVGSPAVQFNSASSTGWYKTANGIGISVNGVKVAEFTSGGPSRLIGELIPWTLLSAPALAVLPYGQTLSRTTYADLWEIAQDEIAAGNTFYNNGNGTTTFGIGDLRGRVLAGKDDMGGSAASRLTTAGAAVDGATLGAVGGVQTVTLTASQIPSITSTTSVSGTLTGATTSNHDIDTSNFTLATGPIGVSGVNNRGTVNVSVSGTLNGTSTSTNTGGTAHSNTQPTMVCNYILFVGA